MTHKDNQGLAQARNTAFELAETEFVFVLNSDNCLYPRAIARLLESLDEGDKGVAYSQLHLFDEECRLGNADVWSYDRLREGNYIDAMALIRKSAWVQVGGYTPMQGWEDYDLWCKFMEAGIEGVFVPEFCAAIACIVGRWRGPRPPARTPLYDKGW